MIKSVARVSVTTMVSLLSFSASRELWASSAAPGEAPECTRAEFDYEKVCPIRGFNRFIRESAEEHAVDPDLLVAHVVRESSCRAWVTGDEGQALGLAQIQPRWWGEELRSAGIISKDKDLYKAEVAVRALAFISSENRRISKGLREAVRRYNGSGPEAEIYAGRVLKTLSEVRSRRLKVEEACEERSLDL